MALSTKVLAEVLESPDGSWPAVPTAWPERRRRGRRAPRALPDQLEDMIGPLGNDRWAAPAAKMLAELARLFGVTDLPPPCPTAADDQSVWMYVAGLTSVADWIGSNVEFFQPVGKPGPAGRASSTWTTTSRRPTARRLTRWTTRLVGPGGHDCAVTVVRRCSRPWQEPRPLQTAVAEIVGRDDRSRVC